MLLHKYEFYASQMSIFNCSYLNIHFEIDFIISTVVVTAISLAEQKSLPMVISIVNINRDF